MLTLDTSDHALHDGIRRALRAIRADDDAVFVRELRRIVDARPALDVRNAVLAALGAHAVRCEGWRFWVTWHLGAALDALWVPAAPVVLAGLGAGAAA